ncbi:MAG: hypothetical protein MUO37_06510 [Methyloceanibacter sp.]|nr:hypothetical protein [Methyloceanibacter sp.]
MDVLVWALSAAAFLTAALSGIAGLGGGTILIGVLYAVGMAPVEAVDLLKQVITSGAAP